MEKKGGVWAKFYMHLGYAPNEDDHFCDAKACGYSHELLSCINHRPRYQKCVCPFAGNDMAFDVTKKDNINIIGRTTLQQVLKISLAVTYIFRLHFSRISNGEVHDSTKSLISHHHQKIAYQ